MKYFIVMSVPIAFLALTMAVILNFMSESQQNNVKTYKKSAVDTYSMYAVVGLMYLAFRLSYINGFSFLRFDVPVGLQLFGVFLVYMGLAVNLLGRMRLKAQWSNMIKIRTGHQVIQDGVYRFVRHPLYASTIWMIIGSGFVYGNFGILVILTFIFYPMMIVRAKQEESLLSELDGYKTYMEKTGRFFPKLLKR